MMGFGWVDVITIIGVSSMIFLLAWLGLPLSILGAAVMVAVGYALVRLLFSAVRWLRRRNRKSLLSPPINASGTAKESVQCGGDLPNELPIKRNHAMSGGHPRAISIQLDVVNGVLYIKS